MKRKLAILVSHLVAVAVGFALGVYYLPILTAPEGPATAQVESMILTASHKGRFDRDLAGSDLFHWGEGEVAVGPDAISFMGKLAPGPDYKLYLVPQFVENETQFLALKDRALRVGDVKTFENFIVPLPESVDLNQYNTVLVWCEAFGEFISAAQYR